MMAMFHGKNDDAIVSAKSWDSKMLYVLWEFAKPFIKWLLIALIIMLIGTSADLVRPYLLKVAIDDQIAKRNLIGLLETAQLYGITIVVSLILSYGQTFLLQYIGQKIIFDIRQKVFQQLIYQHYPVMEGQPVGRMVTRVTNDTDAIKDLYTDVLVAFISDFIMIVGIIIVMLMMDWKLALVSFSVIPVMIWLQLLIKNMRVSLIDWFAKKPLF